MKVVQTDNGEGRAQAIGAIALLAKSPGCRETLVEVEGLMDLIARVMQGAAMIPFVSNEASGFPDSAHMSSITEPEDSQVAESDGARGSNSEEVEEGDEDEEEGDHEQDGDGSEDSASSASSFDSHDPSIPLRRTDSIRSRNEERQTEYAEQSRSNACAVLIHLSKQCSISVRPRFYQWIACLTSVFINMLLCVHCSPLFVATGQY